MADVLKDRKITNNEADRIMKPLELDLTAVFNIMQEDILNVLDGAGIGTSPDDLIKAIDETLVGNISPENAQTITKTLESVEPLLRQVIVYGDIPIRIEQEINSIRSGYDQDGHYWESEFRNPYGYFESTMGVDGDEVDVYFGEYEDTEMVYIIHQRDPVTGGYDEDKVMMFFESSEEAKKTYQKHYDRPGMFGGMTEVDIDQFRRLLRDRSGSKLTSIGIGDGDDKTVLIDALKRLKEYLNGKISY